VERITVTLNAERHLVLRLKTRCCRSRARNEPFHHTDRNTLTRVQEPGLNPLAMPDAPAPVVVSKG
jgi:hypothetical protein